MVPNWIIPLICPGLARIDIRHAGTDSGGTSACRHPRLKKCPALHLPRSTYGPGGVSPDSSWGRTSSRGDAQAESRHACPVLRAGTPSGALDVDRDHGTLVRGGGGGRLTSTARRALPLVRIQGSPLEELLPEESPPEELLRAQLPVQWGLPHPPRALAPLPPASS